MGAQPSVPARAVAWVRQWFAGLGFKQLWQLVIVAVLAATALFGGLEDADTKVTLFEPGEQFDDGQYTLTVERATLLETIDGVLYDTDGSHYLGVVVNIRNNGHTPGSLLKTFQLVGQPKQRLAGTYRLADSTYNANLGPGLEQQTAFFWELPDSAVHAGGTVTLRAGKKSFHELMVTYGEAWLSSDDEYGQITVPVRDRR